MSAITTITIPDTVNGKRVTSIGIYAFWDCPSLTSITIPDSVTSIDNGAFVGCTGLTNITIPDSVTYFGVYVFDGSTSLSNIYYTGTEEQWNEIEFLAPMCDPTTGLTPEWLGVPDATIHFNTTDSGSASTTKLDNSAPANAKYDVNGNNSFDISDVITLLGKVTSGDTSSAYDINNDGVVNINDVITLLRAFVTGKT